MGCTDKEDEVDGKGGKESERQEKEKEEVVKKAMQCAQVISEKSPVAVQGTKELLDWSWDRSVADGLRYTAVWNSAMLQTRDVGEAMGAGMQKRRARFEKL